jgi:phosphate transport system ATP-binding protein
VTVRAGQDGSDGIYRPPGLADTEPAPVSGFVAPATEAPVTEGSVTEGDASDTALQVSDVNAWFGSNQILKNVSMTAKARSVTAIIGPSGSGKSTLIRCLNRMHEEIRGAKISGKVLFQGSDVYAPAVDPAAVRRRIGMVFQRPTPFPTMSIMDNAVAGLKLGSRLRKADMRARGEEALRKAGLWDEVKDRLSQPGGSLSGGQQQRLCIARALAVEPHLLLMDEPASALDPSSTLRIEELMNDIKTRYTVVIVTHNMQQAARVADETIFMLDGEVIEAGPTGEIFKRPADQRTQDYVLGRFG